jgi:hypothetical protein
MRDLWHIRIFDAWIPQQDMRRAVKRPGELEGPGAEHAVGRVAMAMPGSAGRTVALRTEGGRARILDEIPVTPTVRLSLDVETFTCLGCGRWNPTATLQQRKVQITSDTALGQVVVAQMNIII